MKVKIIELFEAYKSQVNETPNVADVFSKSGMVNRVKELDYGFFPLGSGILTKKCKVEEAEIEDRGIMVLGNDFGTCEYLSTKCENKRENEKNPTINNLKTIGLEIEKTFFSNFFLGLRITGKMCDNRTSLEDYKSFCNKFFLTQLKMINPSIVICLGKPVRFILCDFFEGAFSEDIKRKNMTYKELFKNDKHLVKIDDPKLGKRLFVFIPHPSWAHRNWPEDILSKIKLSVKNEAK